MGRLLRAILTLTISVFMVIANMLTPGTGALTTVRAAAGDEPVHNKSISNNHDGTYKLSLDVRGDASTEVSITGRVNVLVIYDTSYSMRYTSGRYTQAAQAEYALRNFTNALFDPKYWNGETDRAKSNIEMSLVTFATNARTEVNWTATPSQITSLLSNNGTNTYHESWYGQNSYNGMYTNWQAANEQGYRQVQAADGDQTFVIFMTDGQPTVRAGANYSQNAEQVLAHYRAAQTSARNIQNYDTVNKRVDAANSNVTYFGIYAYGHEGDYLDDLVYYAHNGSERAQQGTGTVATPFYYNASNTEQLNVAIDDIFGQIADTLGVGSVTIDDGTTNNVQTSSGRIELLEVDDTSFEYWITIPTTGNTFSRYDKDGNEVVYTISGSGPNYTISWAGGNSVTVEGERSAGQLKYKWTEKNALYDFDPPAATYTDGAVQWKLDSVGTLLDGVTYTVTFDVYPSQTTYDLIADLKNGEKDYDSLDSNIRKYLVRTGENSYSLITNTNASLTYTDTRMDDPEAQTVPFNELDPVVTDAEEMKVQKVWIGKYQSEEEQDFDMELEKDGVLLTDEKIHLTYNPATHASEGSHFIAIGLLRVNKQTGKVQVLDEGHDYKLVEPQNLSYHWELHADTMHPMLVNGERTMMHEVTEGAPTFSEGIGYVVSGGKEYYKVGEKVYVAEPGTDVLSATNIRRSNFTLAKQITGNDPPEDAMFQFRLTLTSPDNSAMSFSVFDPTAEGEARYVTMNDGVVLTEGLTPNQTEPTHYYDVNSGQEIVVRMKPGWTLRYPNVLTGTEYDVVEEELPVGFTWKSNTIQDFDATTGAFMKDDTDYTANEDKHIAGEINEGNATVYAIMTNQYNPVTVAPSVTKTVKGWDAISDFEFSIEGGDDATKQAITSGHVVLPDPATVATGAGMKKDDPKQVTFDDITFYREGTYVFTIDETTETSARGWIYDDSTYNVTVTVTADSDGVLQAAISDDNPEFINEYAPDPTEAQIPVLKNVQPEDGLNAPDITGKFTFTLSPVNGAPMPAGSTGTVSIVNGPSGTAVNFPAIKYTEPGTYVYEITESRTPGTESGGVDLETEDPKRVTVVVTDDGSGVLSAAVNGGDALVFNNPYTVKSIDIVIPVEKILEYEDNLTPDSIENKFTFTLTSSDGPLPTTTSVTNPSATGGNIKFGDENLTGKITIDMPGTYHYTITETGKVAGVTNDPTGSQNVVVTVTDNGDGTLSYALNIDKVSFTNTYEVEPATVNFPVKKVLSVPEGLTGPDITEAYTIKVAAVDGAPLPAVTEKKNPDADGGMVDFGAITYDKPGTYKYTVTESGTVAGVSNDPTGTTGKTVTVTVVDNGDGTMTATADSTADNPVTFTNTYDAESNVILIPVEKILEYEDGLTPDSIENKFTFTLTSSDGPLPATTSVTNPSATGGNITFGDENLTGVITVDMPGTYHYTITETGKVAGVTNDPTGSQNVVVTVTDKGDGTLSVSYDIDKVSFTNTYEVEPTTVNFPVKKVLSVPAGLTGPDITEKYTIKVAAVDGAPLPAVTEKKNPDADGGMVDFGAITYDKPGTYKYTVTESGTVAGVTNDPTGTTGQTVTVTVVDNGDGTMTATADSTADNPVTFINSYSTGTISATPAVHKTLLYADGLTPPDITGKYTFTLTAKDGAPMPAAGGESVINPAADGGTVSFGTITYSAPGVYEYEVVEDGTVAGVTNDPVSPKTFKVTVTDNKDGTLKAEIDYGNGLGHVLFENEYKVKPTTVEFPVKKVLEVPEKLTGPDITEKYTIKVEAVGGAPLPEVTEKKNPDADGGIVTFGTITYDKPGTYKYTVSEDGKVAGVTNDPEAAGKEVTVTVVDNSDGTMTAKASSTADDPVTFVNRYSTVPTDRETTTMFNKQVVGMRPGVSEETFSFTVTGSPAPEKNTATVTAKGTGTYAIDFGKIVFTEPGEYTYKLTEVIDNLDGGWVIENNPVEVTVTVVDNTDGTLSSSVTAVTIKNTFDIVTVEGTKSWDDSEYYKDGEPVTGYERPDVTINLKADGKVIDTATATEKGGWNYSFTDLPKYRDHGTEIKYSIEEVLPEGYTNAQGETEYDVINTPVDKEEILNPTEFHIIKIDALTGNKKGLAGAEFTLSDSTGAAVRTYTTDADGKITIAFVQGDIEDGTYTLAETKAPTDYQPVTDTWTVVVNKEFVTVTLNQEKNIWQWIYDLVFGDSTKALFDEDTMTLTVENTPEKTEFEVKKIWNDNDDREQVRPSEIELTLTGTAGGSTVYTNTVTVKPDAQGNWYYKWEDLAKRYDGAEITYAVSEKAIAGYNTKIEDGVITNSHQTKPVKDVFYTSDKTVSIDGEKVEPEAELTYKVTYKNTSGDKVTAVITDEIPEYTSYVDGSADHDGTYADGVLTWTVDLEDGEEVTVSFDVIVSKDVKGEVIKNDADVDDGHNKYTTNETKNPTPTPADKDVYYSGKTDVSIDGEKVERGSRLTYQITYTNTTGRDADVTVTDEIPEHTTYVEGSANNDGKFADGVVTWAMNVKNGETVVFEFDVTVDEEAEGDKPLINDADLVVGENTYKTNEVVNYIPTPPVKDVFKSEDTTMSINGEQVMPDDNLSYSITYKNTTGRDADVTITDEIPEYTTYVDGTASDGGVYTDGVITWNLHVLKDQEITVWFQVKVDSDAEGVEIPNDADVVEGENSYKTNEVINYVPEWPEKDVFEEGKTDVSIDGEKVEPKDVLEYQITYTNKTGKTADVTITDEIPEYTTYVDGSADNGGIYDNGVITWNLTLEYKESVTVSFKVRVNEDAVSAPVVNDANVVEGENTYKTNEVINSIPTPPTKDVFAAGDLTTSIDGEQVQAGETLTYVITYQNTTGKDAVAVITDEISEHTEYVEGSADNGGTFADRTVTWTLLVKNGETVTVKFSVKVTDENKGEVLLNDADVQVGNNKYTTNEVTNYVPEDPTKDVFQTSDTATSIDGEQVKVADDLTYTITYTNKTGKDADVVITDEIPEFTTYVDGSASNGGTYADGTVTWNLKVAYLETVTVSFRVTVDPEGEGQEIPNDADVREGENTYKTNEVINYVPEEPVKDVFEAGKTEISIDGEQVKPGDKLTYQITYTNKTGKTADVTISDEIPEYTTYVDGSASNGGTYADGTVTWNLTLEYKESVTVFFDVTVDDESWSEELLNDANVIEGDNTYTTNEVINSIPTPPTKDVFKSEDTTTSIDGEQVNVDDNLTYAITYKNTTGKDADVTITDEIPEYTEYVDGTASHDGVYADGVITWNLKVAKGEEVTVMFQVKVQAEAEGKEIVNDADVREGENTYKTNEVTNYVPEEPVKEVYKAGETTISIDGEQVKPGDKLTYEITYTNATGKEAEVTITDEIPEFTTYADGSASNGGTYADGVITWNLKLAYKETVKVTFDVTVNDESWSEELLNDANVIEGDNTYTTNEVINSIPTPPTKDVFKSEDTTTSIDGEQVNVDDNLTYAITYKNTTGKDADVTITDEIPEYTEYVDGTASHDGVYADGVITWNLKVAKGEEVTVMFQVKVQAEAEGKEIVNDADVREGENTYKTNEVTNYVPEEPVKEVYKAGETTISIDGEQVKPGDKLTYEITYTNATGKEAEVTITDEIPEHTTYVEGSASNGGTYADGVITWNLKLAYKETVKVTFDVTVDDESWSEELLNDANVIEGDNTYKTNEVINSIPTPPTKDVFKSEDTTTSIDGEQVNVDDNLTYAITYKNTTGKDADVTITDEIPEYTEYVDGTASHDGVYADGVITWNLKVAKGEEVTVMFQVKVQAEAEGKEIVNDADVREGENTYTTNEVTNYVPEEPVKDVFKAGETTVSIDGKQVQPGDELTYTITYTNATGKEAEVTITDEIPEFTTYVDGSASNGGTYADGVITWNLTLPYGESVTVSFNVKVNEDAAGKEILNDADVKEGENTYKTNEVINSIPTPPTKDVFKSEDLTTSIDGKQVNVNDTLTYAITYTNTTGEDAVVVITDEIPEYTEYVDGSASSGGTYTDGVITWTLDVKKNETVTVTFQVKVADEAEGREIDNDADVREGENSYKTNEVTNFVPGEPVKDVFKAGKTDVSIDGKTVRPGDELTYRITYTNATGSEADVTITDEIPMYTTYVDGSASNGGVYADGVITWTLKLAHGESVSVSFNVKVNEDAAGGTVVNDADVREGENTYKTNEVTNPIPTPPVKDVFKSEDTTVSIDGQTVQPGDHLTYAITYRNTTGKDADVTITDKVPEHTTFVSAQNGGTFADGVVTWNLQVKNGETVTVTFQVKVDAVNEATDVPNQAHVIDGENESDTNVVINRIPVVPKTGDEAEYMQFRMYCWTLAGSLLVFAAALVMMILNRKREEENKAGR